MSFRNVFFARHLCQFNRLTEILTIREWLQHKNVCILDSRSSISWSLSEHKVYSFILYIYRTENFSPNDSRTGIVVARTARVHNFEFPTENKSYQWQTYFHQMIRLNVAVAELYQMIVAATVISTGAESLKWASVSLSGAEEEKARPMNYRGDAVNWRSSRPRTAYVPEQTHKMAKFIDYKFM